MIKAKPRTGPSPIIVVAAGFWSILKGIVRPISDYFRQYTPTGRVLLVIAIFALIVDAGIAYKYGVSQTTLHGLGFALMALFFAILPDQAYSAFRAGRWGMGCLFAVAALPIGAMAYYSHLGYGASVRTGDMQQASIQDARYEDTRAKVEMARRNMASALKRREFLQSKREEMLSAQPWAATATATAQRKIVADLEAAAAREAGRGGCGPRCESIHAQVKAEQEKLGALESRVRFDDEIAKLDKQIAATKEWLESSAAEAKVTTAGDSSVQRQNVTAGQLVKLMRGASDADAIKPTQAELIIANLMITGGGSLAFMLMAPLGFLMAGLYRREEDDEDVSRTVSRETVNARATVQPQNHAELTPAMGFIPQSTREIVTNDATIWANLAHRLEQVRAAKQITA